MYLSSDYSSINDADSSTYDGLQCCLPGGFLNCKNGYYNSLENCPELMSNRCSLEWDDKCDEYLNNLLLVEGQEFLKKTVDKKYGKNKNMEDANMTNCREICQLSNPLDPNSSLVCNNVGIIPGYYGGGECLGLRTTHPYSCPVNKRGEQIKENDPLMI